MKRKSKAHVSLRKKLAAALRHMKIEVDGKLVDAIPYDDAKKMTDKHVISLFHFDHGIHETIDGPTEHWNLTPRFIADHRRKTAKIDHPQIDKTKRVMAKQAEFRARVLAKTDPEAELPTAKPKAKIKSRGFQKRPEGHKHQWGRKP